MSAPALLRVGACPGALRPWVAGDGLLLRVKPRGGTLTLAQAAGIASLAVRHGSGAVTLTGRANLQIRGVAPDAAAPLVEGLGRLGLLDASPEAEAARNVLCSPLAGHDARALLDVRPAVAALERRLGQDETLWTLPAKFAWVVDDGGTLPLDGVAADVRFEAVRREGAARFTIRLAGDAGRTSSCGAEAIPETVAALARAFLALCAERGSVPHRMRDLAARCPAATIFERAGLPHAAAMPRPVLDSRVPIGLAVSGPRSWLGLAPPFGWLDAPRLAALARHADAAGAGDLRLTPWRTVLVPGLTEGAARRLRSDLGRLPGPGAALILDAADPRLAVAACSGAPACPRATRPVRLDAARLAPHLRASPGRVALHVSGCAKGCAHPSAAAITLVGRDDGYDLVRHGTAADAPAHRGLSVEAVAAMLGTLEPEPAR